MSFGIYGLLSSVAAAPAQSRALETARVLRECSNFERQTQSELFAADAVGIGTTDSENTTSSERDADGRRLWEEPVPRAELAVDEAAEQPQEPRQSRDATGNAGLRLDITG